MTDEDDWLAHETLTAPEWKAVEELAYKAPNHFEVSANLNIGETLIARLIGYRIAETGPPLSAYQARGYDVGYGLSKFGWRVKERGRYPARKKS
ncbi:MAG: hypothetical protein J0J10_15625 [Bosea sp.]|uniref:hypothetical protein n=1 Tax=Bosea sp. (in: a-proteobacteria) TaxID=1871050 RepID=UPI001AC73B42|nr:hypothetical protein [Bosea sp. (in: a-proteobacteria)]MBN9470193.1 hypothetical protein [Bosea sp. (in: a-proteobacteria)]